MITQREKKKRKEKKRKNIFTSYDLYISNPTLTLETTIFVIHNHQPEEITQKRM
jgi:hypothetical protein